MDFKEQHITFQKSGRYITYGNSEKATTLLIALHGYGQLATFFIRKFRSLDPNKYFIVCPEAPHRFYQTGTSGRVGASWMTKEDRLTDIKDYISFLDTLFADIRHKYSFEKRCLLGFSQGGATASRWIGYGKCDFDVFLLWAAVFPPDMEEQMKTKFNTQKNYFIIGTKDEYATVNEAKEKFDRLNSGTLQFEFITFEGNHTVDATVLHKLIV